MKLFIMTNTKLRLRKNKSAKVRNYYKKSWPSVFTPLVRFYFLLGMG